MNYFYLIICFYSSWGWFRYKAVLVHRTVGGSWCVYVWVYVFVCKSGFVSLEKAYILRHIYILFLYVRISLCIKRPRLLQIFSYIQSILKPRLWYVCGTWCVLLCVLNECENEGVCLCVWKIMLELRNLNIQFLQARKLSS